MPYSLFSKALSNLNLTAFFNDDLWVYKPNAECLQINGDYTYDLDLCFTIEDMRQLYRWETGMEFLAICELASGDFPECHRDLYPNFEDFKVCVEGKMS